MIFRTNRVPAAWAVVALLLLLPETSYAQRAVPDELALGRLPRVHGLSPALFTSDSLLLATPVGLFLSAPDGKARIVEGMRSNVMGYTVHPKDTNHHLAGGHGYQGGGIGVMRSKDGGKSWQQISGDGDGGVGFHILKFSPVDPSTVYGVANDLRVSADGGQSWTPVGPLPRQVIDLAPSAVDARTVYAATQQGLMMSRDRGANWIAAQAPPGITSMVHTTPSGTIYLFIVGKGLMMADERTFKWATVSNNFKGRILLRMTHHPKHSGRLYASTVTGAVVMSQDGGKGWIGFEGSHRASPAFISKGKTLFETNCQVCHGAEGKGQHTTANFNPKLPPPIMAPALDDSAHGWHHSDEDLIATILNGSPQQGSPMVGWKDRLSRQDAESLVAYIKSLWSFPSIACQGARHMACMRH